MFTTKSLKLIAVSNITRSQLNLTRTCTSRLDPIKQWWKPKKVSCVSVQISGDLKPYEEPKKDEFFNKYVSNSELMKDADDIVKELFSLEMQPRKMSVYSQKLKAMQDVQRHVLDYGSVETNIANTTVRIRAMQEMMKVHPRNRRLKVHLKEAIEKRFSLLSSLRKWDYKRFEWILEKCDIIYKPFPEEHYIVARRDSIRKLTDVFVDRIKNEKITEYRKLLESQQLDFLKKKLENLEFIRNEQIECKVPVTVTLDDIKVARKKYEEHKKKREEEEEVLKKQNIREDYELNL